MGLIKAAAGALGGTMADQWKEFFYCDSMDADVLMVKGQKRTSGRSSNRHGEDNIISNGSGIAVADGQCMLIVEQGQVVEVCAEPGEFTFDSSSEPSIFTGDLGDSIELTFRNIGRRFTYGGDTGKDQRVYYVNTKEILDNKFGTPSSIMFRVVDSRIGLDKDVYIRCNGIYSYRITDPLTFYTNVAGNVSQSYDRTELDSTLKGEFISALQPAFAKLSELELRPSQIPAHAAELEDAMNEALTKKWHDKRGISVVSVAMNPITLREEDMDKIRQFQDAAVLTNTRMAAATLAGAQADAMKAAASNPNGGMMGFMGMNMASQAGGMNAMGLYQQADREAAAQQQAAQQQAAQQQAAGADSWTCSCGTVNSGKFCVNCGSPKPAPADSWTCSCGTVNSGKFCINCGKPKPAQEEGWTCSCGTVNKGRFCMNCGAKKPAGAPLYRCDKCGWEPDDPHNPPRFCPRCGDPFDDNDVKE